MPYVLPTPSPTAETFPRVPPTVTTSASSELSTGPGFDVDSNTANAALPLLPRRRPVPRLETPEDESDDHPVVDLDDSSNASSSTVTGISVPKLSVSTSRPRRIRGQRMPGSKPVAEDTPESPTPTPADSIPFPTFNSRNHLTVHKPVSPGRAGTLRLNLEALRRTYSESQVPSTAPCTVANPAAIPYVRKKSGELVKPSLKQCQAYAGHRSVPTTPTTPKSVHFDSQLEHVKLFLAEQKPLAVSRDGSPEETSEAEDSDRYPYPGSSEDERIRSTLTMEICNMPSIPRLHDECRLESIKLAHDKSGIEGQVIVRNIAFSKWVAIRFTFDDWQTTSEVTGRYVSSLDGGAYDRFAFVIKLGDVLPRVHEKTLLMALRYSVAGRDIWDNNAGQNYRFTFKRDAAPTPLKKQKEFVLEPKNKNRTSWSDEDLKKRLEQVVNEDAEDTARLRTRAWVRMAGSTTSPVKDQGESLKARYDFGKSLNSTWSPNLPVASPPPSVAHYMPRTPPTGASSLAPAASSNAKPTARVPFPPKNDAKPNMNLDLRLPTPRTLPRGSPRDIEGQSPTHHARFSLEVDDDESYGPQLPPLRLRNHTRSSYFDGWNTASPMFLTGGAKVTSPTRSENDNTSGSGPGTPVMRYNSFPMDNNSRSQLGPSEPWRAPSPVGSLASTPSVTSASSPSHSPSSPSESLPSEDPLSVIDLHAASAKLEGESDNRSAHNSESYHTFLDQFCFFRGPTATPAIDFTPRRTHSASELEQLASTSPFGSPRSGSEPQFGYTLGSYNGMLNVSSECLSGQVTPTNNASPLCGTQAKGECLTPRPGTPSDFANTSPSATPRIVAGF